MSFGTGILTGRALGAQVNCDQRMPEPCLLFTPDSPTYLSHVFEVEEAKVIRAFDMADGETLTVEMVAGEGSGHMFAPMIVGGRALQMVAPNNVLVIPIPGRYRLRFGGILGEVTAFCEPIKCCTVQSLVGTAYMGDRP